MQNPSAQKLHVFPAECQRSDLFRARINGHAADILSTNGADFLSGEFPESTPIQVEIEIPRTIDTAVIRPLRHGNSPVLDGNRLRFQMAGPQHLSVEINNLKPLFIYANAPEISRPRPDDPKVRFFATGKIHETGEIRLGSGETLYIEAGAVVRGHVHITGADPITLAGHGILDGCAGTATTRNRSIIIESSRNVRVRDLIMIRPTAWMLVLGKCDGVHVSNLKQIGEVVSSDGIDICGSRNVLIEDCFLRNNDDCVVVKSTFSYDHQIDWCDDVENVEVRNCVLMNAGAGNVMEIGFELRTEHVRNIRFHDIDVLWKHSIGAIFSINNTDRATVSDVVFENIRVEHYYDKLVSIRISESRYSKDKERGRVRRVLFKNIAVTKTPANDGYSHSLIGGFDDEHNVDGVVFENFVTGGVKATRARHIDLFTRYAEGIEFR